MCDYLIKSHFKTALWATPAAKDHPNVSTMKEVRVMLIYIFPPILGIGLLAYRTDFLHNMYTLRSRINSLILGNSTMAEPLVWPIILSSIWQIIMETLFVCVFFFYQRMKMKGLKVEALFALIFLLTFSQTWTTPLLAALQTPSFTTLLFWNPRSSCWKCLMTPMW